MIKFEFVDLEGLQTFYNNIKELYVKKVNGKNLSTNDFDNIYKEKVDNNTLERHNHSNKSILDIILQPLIDTWNTVTNKVDKVTGMGLSANNYTDSEKFKLRNIQDNAEVNVQNDWNENDDTLDSFIKNKPTKLSQFSNDNGFITNTVNNLQNYYTKTQSYNKTEVDILINSIITLNISIVESFPITNISTTTIYLILKTDSIENDIYNEYINLDGTTSGWEYIGNTNVDLTDYYKKSEINVLLNDKVDKVDSVIGVKGNEELTYRTGNINITSNNIGLGNVPNVSTNNQTPTYEEATTLQELTSGEKLSIAFGKLKLGIKNLKTIINLIGTTDISKIGDGTITNALFTLNSDLGVQNQKLTLTNVTRFDVTFEPQGNVGFRWVYGPGNMYGYALNIRISDGTMQFYYYDANNNKWMPSWTK